MERNEYLTTSGVVYELMICRLGRYQSIVNGGNKGGRVNSNVCGNQQNQRQNIMFLQKDTNGGNLNGCSPEDHLVPKKDGSTCSLECYYFHEWLHISNNFPQINPDHVCGRGGRRGGGACTGGRSGTGLLQTRVGFAQNTDGMIPSLWILLDT